MPSQRIQLELPEKSLERLQHLKAMIEASSYGEVLRNALRLYEYVINESSQGATFLIQQEGKAPEVIKFVADEAS